MGSQRIGHNWGTITHSLQSLWIRHFKLWGMWKVKGNMSVVFNSLRPHGLWPTRSLCPRDCTSENTGAGRHSLLQGNFLTQGLHLSLLHCRWILTVWGTREALWEIYPSPFLHAHSMFRCTLLLRVLDHLKTNTSRQEGQILNYNSNSSLLFVIFELLCTEHFDIGLIA